jgi:hypothetical protein
VDDRAKLIEQASCLERELAVLLMDIELSALHAGLRGRVGLVDRGANAVDVKDAREGEAAEARADNGDR